MDYLDLITNKYFPVLLETRTKKLSRATAFLNTNSSFTLHSQLQLKWNLQECGSEKIYQCSSVKQYREN